MLLVAGATTRTRNYHFLGRPLVDAALKHRLFVPIALAMIASAAIYGCHCQHRTSAPHPYAFPKWEERRSLTPQLYGTILKIE